MAWFGIGLVAGFLAGMAVEDLIHRRYLRLCSRELDRCLDILNGKGGGRA